MHAKSLQPCRTLCNSMDCSPLGSSVPGILQARILQSVAVPSFKIHLKESESESPSVLSDSVQTHGLYSPCSSPGQNIGVGSLSFLQGIFPTWGSNPGLLHYRQIFYPLRYMEALRDNHEQAKKKKGIFCPYMEKMDAVSK